MNSSNKIIFGMYGAGGFAREIIPVAKQCMLSIMQSKEGYTLDLFFIETSPSTKEINGYPIVSEDEFFAIACETRYFNIAIADSKVRASLATRMCERGAEPISVLAPQAVTYEQNIIGPGAVVCAFSTVTSNVKIGRFFHSNIYSYVAHDCIIGDFVTFAPGVHCNGNVHIHNHAYIGTGAIIRQGTLDKPIVIGEGAVVGMGAVVTKDVPPYTTVVGNPAKPFIKG